MRPHASVREVMMLWLHKPKARALNSPPLAKVGRNTEILQS